MDTYQQVADFIHQERLLQPGQRLVAGVSGGPDSLCLLDCLNRLGYQIIVAHLDHQLRPESAEEATFVQQVAQTYGVLAVIERWDRGVKVGPGSSVEEAARLAQLQYQAGTITNLQANQIQANLTNARANYAQALFNYTLANIRIKKAVGRNLVEELGVTP